MVWPIHSSIHLTSMLLILKFLTYHKSTLLFLYDTKNMISPKIYNEINKLVVKCKDFIQVTI